MDLISILENLLPVRFAVSDGRPATGAGEIIIEDSAEWAQSSEKPNVSSLRVPVGREFPKDGKLIEIGVNFVDDPDVPFPFQGRSLRSKVAAEARILRLSSNEKALANVERGPVWAVSREGGVMHFRSGFALPRIPADGCLTEVLHGERFLEILPLLHWLRETCSKSTHNIPPLRACFMFDDPNLHWPHYGFVDYRQLVEHAERENYHVSFATIPFDTWFTHRGTANIFRNHQSRLSLLVHGNNHTKGELARPYAEPERVFLLKQAIQRIERLERRSGLAVSRVMVPPHGACSEEMLAALPIYGFDAACISHGSLRAHNKSRAWTKTLGFLPSERIRACPVLPRWAVSGDLKNTILLAAFLKQAIILRGHHHDLKDGPDLLNELARFVNGLGSVAWLNMTDMARFDYSDRQSEVSQIDGVNDSIPKPSFGEVIALETEAKVSLGVDSKRAGQRKPRAISNAYSLFRRLATEGRDRFLLKTR